MICSTQKQAKQRRYFKMGSFLKKNKNKKKVPNVIKQIDDAYNKSPIAKMLIGKRK